MIFSHMLIISDDIWESAYYFWWSESARL